MNLADMTPHDKVRALFDATIAHLRSSRGDRFRDRQIFVEVLGEERTRDAFPYFLHDVTSCPPKVITWCQEQLRH